MNHDIILSVKVLSVCLVALMAMSCSRDVAEKKTEVKPGEPISVKAISTAVETTRIPEGESRLDTNISPEMLKDIQWGTTQSEEINSANNAKHLEKERSGISITPNLLLKNEKDVVIKDNYLEYIDGAGINVNVKFD